MHVEYKWVDYWDVWPTAKMCTELHICNYSQISSHWNYPKHFQSITFQIGEYPIYGYHSWKISYSLCAHFKLLVYLTYSCLFISLSGILFIKVGIAFAVFCWNLQVNMQWICQERTYPNYRVPYSDYPQQSCSLGSPWTPNIKMQF